MPYKHWVDFWPNSEAQKHFQAWHPPVRVLPYTKEYYEHGCRNVLNFAIRRIFSGNGLLTITIIMTMWALHLLYMSSSFFYFLFILKIYTDGHWNALKTQHLGNNWSFFSIKGNSLKLLLYIKDWSFVNISWENVYHGMIFKWKTIEVLRQGLPISLDTIFTLKPFLLP